MKQRTVNFFRSLFQYRWFILVALILFFLRDEIDSIEKLKPIVMGVSLFKWIIFAALIIFWLREQIISIAGSLAFRIKHGASLKLASFELGPNYVAPDKDLKPMSSTLESRHDKGDERERERIQYYRPNRGIMLVHRIVPSAQKGQRYDILIYLIPHKDATIASISKVEYYFGTYWKSQIFTVYDRARNFPIATSAYGEFVCTAKLHFSDGETCILSRYIDFEMGSNIMNSN